mmetsp:Transcript_42392/g.92196  ORF Transcript_42392/g.92196 Transcript_42392/m.92196 type:complete len:80 (-) Transcript_42392:340-579(-)
MASSRSTRAHPSPIIQFKFRLNWPILQCTWIVSDDNARCSMLHNDTVADLNSTTLNGAEQPPKPCLLADGCWRDTLEES